MINVMATKKLPVPVVIIKNHFCNTYHLPPASCIQLKADNEIAIKRSILHLITIPNLRTAHIFHFKKETTTWELFEPYRSPLTANEIKGTMVFAIKQFRDLSFPLVDTNIRSNAFIHSTKSIISRLESFDKTDRIYIILVFKDCSYAIGNYFDETTICRALLKYRPRKVEKVISTTNEDKHSLFIYKRPDLLEPKRVNMPIFCVQ